MALYSILLALTSAQGPFGTPDIDQASNTNPPSDPTVVGPSPLASVPQTDQNTPSSPPTFRPAVSTVSPQNDQTRSNSTANDLPTVQPFANFTANPVTNSTVNPTTNSTSNFTDVTPTVVDPTADPSAGLPSTPPPSSGSSQWEDPRSLYGPMYGEGYQIRPSLPARGWWYYGFRYTLTLCPSRPPVFNLDQPLGACILQSLETQVQRWDPSILPGWLVPEIPVNATVNASNATGNASNTTVHPSVVIAVATELMYGGVSKMLAPCNWVSFIIPFNFPIQYRQYEGDPTFIANRSFAQPLMDIMASQEYAQGLATNCSIPAGTTLSVLHKGVQFDGSGWVTSLAAENGVLSLRQLTATLMAIPLLSLMFLWS